MKIPSEQIAIQLAVERLAEVFGVPELTDDAQFVTHETGSPWDAICTVRGYSFGLIWKRSGSLDHVAGVIRQLGVIQSGFTHEPIPLLIVPYMGKRGQERCAPAQLAWLDLSGNARIVAPNIFYQNVGNPNSFRRPGRPESAFGPRGSRITRRLLMDPSVALRQRTLASDTGLDEGHTSRIVGKLLETGLVERRKEGIMVVDADLLLDAWAADYQFDRHHVIRGHIPAFEGYPLTRFLAETLSKAGELYAATALPAAWLWTHYARFRLSTMYVARLPSRGLKNDLDFREEARGANVWLVVPNDQSVFYGADLVDGIHVVHPLQAYVDLKDHPEATPEAGAELRRQLPSRAKNGI